MLGPGCGRVHRVVDVVYALVDLIDSLMLLLRRSASVFDHGGDFTGSRRD